MLPKIHISTAHFGGGELKYINNILTSNGYDNNIAPFEQDLEAYLGNNVKVAALSAGTAAIHLALILSGVQREDVVLCQSFTFSASANPIAYQGAIPVFIDSEKDTWNMCPIALEKAIQENIAKGTKPKAIIVVHLYGMPAKIEEIATIAKKYGIKLIEDAAEALGSTYKNQKCGTFGDFGILSFNGNKIITTSGGGALVCKTEENKQKAIFLATQARDEAPHYQHSQIGYNYRMSNIVAGIGRGQMEVLDKHIALRRANNEMYQEIFAKINGVTVFTEPNTDYFSNHWLSCIVVDENVCKVSTEQIRLALLEANIESRPLWKPMHLQPVFEGTAHYGTSFSETLFQTGLCLPSGSNLTPEDKERVKNKLCGIFK